MSTSGTILVVDDQSANVQLVGQLLHGAGYEVVPALSGAQALERASATRPDLALLDMFMPVLSGAEVCERLHALPECAGLPVIFVTAAAEREHLARAFAHGAVDYITKPFVAEELLARVKTHVELKQARDRLQRMLREREDLTDIVAHDLKNPLSNIRFAAELMRRGGVAGGERAELAHDILQSAEQALAFIKRFLARRADGERLRQLSARPVELRALAEDAARLQGAAAAAQEVKLAVEGEAIRAQADPLALANVLQNLVANAIRYSPHGSAVTLAVGPSRPGFARCAVLDRGPGIDPAEQHKLFQRFARIATARDTPAGADRYSSGLGLAIAKHDVAQMGGHLWYEDRAGGGSVFALELPAASPDADTQRDAPG